MNKQAYTTGDVTGDVIGTGASGIAAQQIHGNVIQVIIRSKDKNHVFDRINEVPTEVDQDQPAGLEGSKIIKDSKILQDNISELLNLMQSAEKQGENVNEVQAGNLHLSKVELLLKKAILIKTDADQIDRKQPDGLVSDSRQREYIDKLKEANQLLKEALEIDPANTEVLLHMAQVLMDLTPDDPTDEQKLLNKVRNLLSYPKNDSERFRLAQATFLLATTGAWLHREMLTDAKTLFQKLKRNEWVRQCDELLKKYDTPKDPPSDHLSFEPSGHWKMHVSDSVESTMEVSIRPDGYFDATQQTGLYGLDVKASGQWAYIPTQRMLQLQGFVNGLQPFFLGILIHNKQDNVFYGVGTDSYSYTLEKL